MSEVKTVFVQTRPVMGSQDLGQIVERHYTRAGDTITLTHPDGTPLRRSRDEKWQGADRSRREREGCRQGAAAAHVEHRASEQPVLARPAVQATVNMVRAMGKIIDIVARVDERFGGRELRGSYRVDDEIVTAWHPDGRKKSAQVGGSPAETVAKILLLELEKEVRQ
jgi:hypothetical protein